MNIGNMVKNCYGCGACKNICSFDAISIKEDNAGFFRAFVDYDKCKECGQCTKVCPEIVNKYDNTETPECYAAWAKDDIRLKCASGGIFTAIALQIIERGGWVAGAVWKEDYHVGFIVTNTIDGLNQISNSKYVQGDMGKVHTGIKEKLDEGQEVLFCGCPCQVAGLKGFLRKDYPKLYTMDLICHGVPSQKMLKKYLKDLYSYEDIEKVDFRDKSHFGWSTEMNIYFKDGKIIRKRATEDAFYRAFLNNMSLNPTCERCQFSKIPRQGNLSLGDFWQIEKYEPRLNDRKGTSLILVNNRVGKNLLDACDYIELKEKIPFEFIGKTCNSTVFRPFRHHFASYRFLREFSEQNFEKSVNQCLGAHYDIGLITTWFARNFGAIFTAYALYKKLQEMGYSVLMIHKPLELWQKDYFDPNRSNIAVDFGNRYYNVSKQYSVFKENQQLNILNNHCDVFMTGSDQLWNPRIYAKLFYFFMDFVDDKHKKIAYATSIGADHFQGTPEEKYRIEYLLSRFDNISVREQEAVNVCVDEFGVNARQVIDPVFLIEQEHYANMSNLVSEKKEVPNEYIFVYMLDGNTPKRDFIKRVEEKYNLPVVCAYDIEQPEMSKRYLQLPEADISKPEDWLWYIRNSRLIITDSFHGACFSIIFNKEFLCIGNKLRGINRFYELFSKLKIRNRLIVDIENANEIEKVILALDKKIDYSRVRFFIECEKRKSLIWLNDALHKEKSNKMSHEEYLFEGATKSMEQLKKEVKNALHIISYSDISQLGLRSGCSIQDIINKMEKNSVLQQVQGQLGEPIVDTPAPYGVLTIKKTSDYFIEVTFSEMTGRVKKPCLWLANVTEKKVLRWSRFVEQDMMQLLQTQVKNNREELEKVKKESHLKGYSDISQIGLSAGCNVNDIVEHLGNNAYLQQVQGRMGEPIADTPMPYGVLSIKKTSDYFIEVTFTEIAKGEKSSCLWLADVVGKKILGWSRMISSSEVDQMQKSVLDDVQSTQRRVEELEQIIQKYIEKNT